MARTPHGYHDTALIRSDLAKAGFANVSDRNAGRKQSRAPSPHVTSRSPTAKARRCATRSRPADADRLEAATDHAAAAIARSTGSGAVAAKIQAHVIRNKSARPAMATVKLLSDDELSSEARAVDDIRKTRQSDFVNNFGRGAGR